MNSRRSVYALVLLLITLAFGLAITVVTRARRNQPRTHHRPSDDGSPIIASFDSLAAAESCVADLQAAGFGGIRFISEDDKARVVRHGLSDASTSTPIPPDTDRDTDAGEKALERWQAPTGQRKEESDLERPSSEAAQGFRAGQPMLHVAPGGRMSEATEIIQRAGGHVESPLITGMLLEEAKPDRDAPLSPAEE